MSRAAVALLCLAAAAPTLAAPELPFDPPSLATLRASPRKVFAHYFPPFPVSLDNKPSAADYYTAEYLAPDGEHGKYRAGGGYLRERPLPRAPRSGGDWVEHDLDDEVRHAVALGLDGFACDVLGSSGRNWERVRLLLDAAARADKEFRVLLMPDMNAEFGREPERLADAVAALASHPAAYRLSDGRLVIAPFKAQVKDAGWWRTWLDTMRARGVEVAFVPVFLGWQRHADAYAPIAAGLSDWGPRWPSGAAALREAPAAAHHLHRLWMAPVAPQDFRPKSLTVWESAGSLAYRTMWESAITGGADWVHVITWNDYSEGTEIAPSTGTGWAFYDLTAYYVAWFKTGSPPPIVRDVLYYFHRVQPVAAAPVFRLGGGDPLRDEIELLAFLKAPGTLEATVGDRSQHQEAPAGMTSVRVALAPGRPVFSLRREGKPVVTLTSQWTIRNAASVPDLLYRAGGSNRPAVAGR